jgi:hypothetical protein
MARIVGITPTLRRWHAVRVLEEVCPTVLKGFVAAGTVVGLTDLQMGATLDYATRTYGPYLERLSGSKTYLAQYGAGIAVESASLCPMVELAGAVVEELYLEHRGELPPKV